MKLALLSFFLTAIIAGLITLLAYAIEAIPNFGTYAGLGFLFLVGWAIIYCVLLPNSKK